MNQSHTKFKSEVSYLFIVSIGNLVIAALAVAYGVVYIITAVTQVSALPLGSGLQILTGAVAMTCFGLGISWITTTVRIFNEVEEIRDLLYSKTDTISGERITCLMVQMFALYRDERDTIGRMILISTGGGLCFLILGISNAAEILSRFTQSGISVIQDWLLIPASLIMFGIAAVSLLSSHYLSRFVTVYDQRLGEIADSECTLNEKLGIEKQ